VILEGPFQPLNCRVRVAGVREHPGNADRRDVPLLGTHGHRFSRVSHAGAIGSRIAAGSQRVNEFAVSGSREIVFR
jgi:hypothetical protein